MKSLLPLLALAACTQQPASDDFVYMGGNIYAQEKELHHSDAQAHNEKPVARFIVRIDPKTHEFYSVYAAFNCGHDRMRIIQSDHHKGSTFISRGVPPKAYWYPIPDGTPADKLSKAVCNPPEQS